MTDSATSTRASAATTRTSVTRVSPVDAHGHLRTAYKVTRSLGAAQCLSGSEATGNAYRCFAGNYVVDPCWVMSNHAYVACLSAPWSRSVWRLHVTRGYQDFGVGPGAANYPWGTTLTNGWHCDWLQGASGFVGSYRISYGCTGHPSYALVGSVDKSHAVWRIRLAHDTGGYHFRIVGWTNIARAWFGKASLRA